jgi:uncharacterized protein (TIGR02118 family)
MLKAMFFLFRRPDMSAEEFQSYHHETHVPIVSKVSAVRRYVVNHTAINPAGAENACDAVTELWFDSMDSFQAAVGSPEGAAVFGDQPNFLDMTRTHALFMDEKTVL